MDLKAQVKYFWDTQSCGEVYAEGESERSYYESQSKTRYALEPYILEYAGFHEGRGKDVLEIGVGMGADYLEWAKSEPGRLVGVDLSARAIEHAKKRLGLYGLASDLRVADAEQLPFPSDSFDVVYSWGVLHHSPDTLGAVREVFRVLRPGGTARIMIYHKYSLTGYMLWLRYGLLTGRLFRSLDQIYWHHLESPGTKAYSRKQAREMFSQFSPVNMRVRLSFGDLLQGDVGARHKGLLLTIAKRLWPRPVLKLLFRNHGLMLLIEACKPQA